jgi:hypothetical protein
LKPLRITSRRPADGAAGDERAVAPGWQTSPDFPHRTLLAAGIPSGVMLFLA